MAEWNFDQANRIATILAPDTDVTIQELYNEFRHHEGGAQSMAEPRHLDGAGKFDLGGGIITVVSVRLEDGWRVAFEGRAGPGLTSCTITGGNLGAVDVDGITPIWPIANTAFVSTSFAQATTGGLADPEGFDQIANDIAQIQVDIAQINTDLASQLALVTGIDARSLGEHITSSATGLITITSTTLGKRWQAQAYEDADKNQVYRGEGMEAADELVEVAYP